MCVRACVCVRIMALYRLEMKKEDLLEMFKVCGVCVCGWYVMYVCIAVQQIQVSYYQRESEHAHHHRV